MPALLLAGCDMYFGGGDDAPCLEGDYAGIAAEYRDPMNGTCITGGYGGCDDGCGPCPAAAEPAVLPDMGMCQSQCTGLAPDACAATAGCYASWFEDRSALKPEYEGCWQTAPSGPVQGTCSGLGAYECSRHDDCELIYARGANDAGVTFVECRQETYFHGCSGGGSDCAPGYHCEEQCYPSDDPGGNEMGSCQAVCVPDGNACLATDCAPGYTCVETCDVQSDGTYQCGPSCVPDTMDPGACTGTVACDALPPSCPSGTTAGIRNGCWTGYCIPNSACGPNDPGDCYGTVICATAGPSCPTGTTPGVENGCYTGYCIPTSQCPLAACETLSSENACDARGDCTPVYTGTDCTCYPDGCSCGTLTYDRCESVTASP